MGDFAGYAAPAVAILVAAVAGFFKLMHSISVKFTVLADKIEKIVNDHEKRDEDRHNQNIGKFDEVRDRLTRVETIVNGYNGRGRKGR